MYHKISKKKIAQLVENNYGSIYKSSGGGKAQIGGMPVKRFMKRVLGNRVLDLYLKYGGLKTLTTATMVPVALILGKDYIEGLIKGQVGGGDPIPKKIPILDDPLVGTYLKLAGLSSISITLNSLVPLGVIMIAHDLYAKHLQSGGASLLGSSIPPNIFQNMGNAVSGHSPSLIASTNYTINDTPVANMQCSDGSCIPNIYSSYYNDPGVAKKVVVQGMPEINIPTKTVSSKWSGSLGVHKSINIPSSMAGGGNMHAFKFIHDPVSKKKVNIQSKRGQDILNKYLKKV